MKILVILLIALIPVIIFAALKYVVKYGFTSPVKRITPEQSKKYTNMDMFVAYIGALICLILAIIYHYVSQLNNVMQ